MHQYLTHASTHSGYFIFVLVCIMMKGFGPMFKNIFWLMNWRCLSVSLSLCPSLRVSDKQTNRWSSFLIVLKVSDLLVPLTFIFTFITTIHPFAKHHFVLLYYFIYQAKPSQPVLQDKHFRMHMPYIYLLFVIFL